MSEKQEHRKRYNRKLIYIAEFDKWLDSEPSMFNLIAWHKWKKQRPVFNEVEV